MAAQPSTAGTVKQRIIFLVLDKVQLLDLAGAAQLKPPPAKAPLRWGIPPNL
ncbi:MAG: hypothetical protein WCA35_15085 [Kovacikia sp.]